MTGLRPPKQLINRLFFICLALFIGISLFDLNAHWFTALVSLPLIFAFPGYYLSRFWKNTLPAASRISYSIIFSFSLHIALLTIFKQYISLNPRDLSLYLILANACIAVIYWLFFIKRQKPDIFPYSWSDVSIASIPSLMFLLNYATNPLVSEGDSYYFIYAAIDSFKNGVDVSPYINRPGFIPFLGLLHQAGGESFELIFRFILSALFYAGSLMVFDFIKRYSKNFSLSRWFTLAIIAAPVLTTEVDIARTQSLVFAITIPVLVLLSYYLYEKKVEFLIIASALSLIGTRVHELSYVLLFTCLLCAAAYGVRYFLQIPNRRKAWGKAAIGIAALIIIAFPYYKLLQTDPSFSFVYNSSRTIIATFLHPTWTWWFLSSYTADGWQLGWTGIQAALYYLYNGILLLFAGGLVLALTKKRLVLPLILPAAIFSFIYFAVAEILPRMHLFYYPNRAWPHLMIGVAVLLLGLTLEIEWRANWQRILAIIGMSIAVLTGLAGWVKLSYDKGGFFTKQEIGIRNYIRDMLPADATLYVVQSSNQAIISVYSNKQSKYVPYQSIFNSADSLAKAIDATKESPNPINPVTLPRIKKTTIVSIDGTVLSETEETLPPSIISIPEPVNPTKDLYFYYSFARFNGYIGQRDWWREVNSYQNFDFFKKYSDQNVVYRDDAGIIIKLK